MPKKWYPFISLFSFAELQEQRLIILGFISTIVCSWGAPTLYVVFGNVINIFTNYQANNRTISAKSFVKFPFLKSFQNFRKGQFDDGTLFTHEQEFLFQIEFFSVFLLCVGILYIVTTYLGVLCFELSAHSQILNIKRRLFAAILGRPFGRFDIENSQQKEISLKNSPKNEEKTLKANEFSTRITNDLKTIERGMNENLCLFVYFSSSTFANIFYALFFGWKLALAVFALTPIVAFSSAMLTKIQSSFVRKEMKAYGEAGIFANEIFSSITTVFAFNGQSRALDDYRARLEPTRKMFLQKSLFTAASNSIAWAAIFSSLALGLYVGVSLCNSEPENYSIGTIILVFWCSAAVGWNLGYAAPYMENVRTACSVAKVIHQNLFRDEEDAKLNNDLPVTFAKAPRIQFCNIHFVYPARPSVKIFSGLNLSIEAGETVAIVGSTGSGKSSLLQLLQRFYSPSSGRILLDGKNIEEMEAGSLRQQFGVVDQEPILFDMSIFENIRLGSSDKNFDKITLDHVIMATKESNAHEFISQLPDGYRTRVGQGGAQLSGGQKQRIAISRAVLKNPAVLLLDEATSALDAQSEYLVQVALEKASKNRTTIIVAHRLSTIIHADRIVCLGSNGEIVETGTHNELIQKEGLYRKLFHSQLDSVDSLEKNSSQFIKQQELVRLPDNRRKYSMGEKIDGEDRDLSENKKWVTVRLFKMLFRYKVISVLAVISALLFGLCIPIYAYIFGNFVANVFANKNSNQNDRLDQDKALSYSIKFLILALYAFLTFFTQSILFAVATEKLTRKLRLNTFWAILERNVSWFDKNTPGAICCKLSEDPSDIQTAIGPKTAMFCQALSTLLVSISVGFYSSWKLSCVTIWFVPVIAISSSFTAAVVGDQSNKEREQNTRAASLAAEALKPSGIRTIKSLKREKYFVEKYKDELLVGESKFFRTTSQKSFSMAIALTTPTLAYAVSFYYGGRLVSTGELKVSHFVLVIEAMIFGAIVFGQACFFSSDFSRARSSAAGLFELIDWARDNSYIQKVSRVRSSNYLIGYTLNNCRGEIEFSSISFSYPNRSKTHVLKNFNLKILPGTKVAFVGSNGCGKSTLLKLLLRFYSPSNGKILLDGVNIAELPQNWLRSQISLVSQEPSLFSASIRDNIAYGLTGKDDLSAVRLEDIRQAARKAQADEFITKLPEQYQTYVCSSLLSGGQRQRIVIARAMIRASPILLFDEATSALDFESEGLIQKAVESIISGRTCLIVAHRLSTIKDCNRIVFIENGQIVEDGTHEELLRFNGKYSQMWTSQFKNI